MNTENEVVNVVPEAANAQPGSNPAPVAYALYAAGVLLCRRLPAARIIAGQGWRCGIMR